MYQYEPTSPAHEASPRQELLASTVGGSVAGSTAVGSSKRSDADATFATKTAAFLVDESTADLAPTLVQKMEGEKEEEAAAAMVVDDLEEPAYMPALDTGFQATKADEGLGHPVAGCPELRVGSKLDKVMPLMAGRWVKIGRHKKSQLLLTNTGISRTHCMVRWDSHKRIVEVRDMATDRHNGTLVNGEAVAGGSKVLKHGDRIRIEGKGIRYDFVLDTRPIGQGVGDPTTISPAERSKLPAKPAKGVSNYNKRKLEQLQKQLAKFSREFDVEQDRAIEKEKQYWEVVTKRRVRSADVNAMEEQCKVYATRTEVLDKELSDSRAAWLLKLEETAENNMEVMRPLTEKVGEAQNMLEKLQLKKDELERTLHPEKYAIADVAAKSNTMSISDSKDKRSGPQSNSVSQTRSIRDGEDAGDGNEDGEDEFFSTKKPKVEDAATKVEAPPAGDAAKAADTLEEELFGEYDSADEAAPAKP